MAGLELKADRGIRKASVAFYRILKNPSRKMPWLVDWAYFHSFKALTGFESCREICLADASYYGDKGEYFYPLKGHIARRMVGRVFKALIRSALKLIVKE